MALTSRLRVIFLLWTRHNFTKNTVFQAFFFTLLAEPGLGKQIRAFFGGVEQF
jgi:hypothetical protein